MLNINSIIKDTKAVAEGGIYTIITIAFGLVVIIALGPIVQKIEELFLDMDSSGSNLAWDLNNLNMVLKGIDAWEYSIVFFVIIAFIYWIARILRKQGFSEYQRL